MLSLPLMVGASAFLLVRKTLLRLLGIRQRSSGAYGWGGAVQRIVLGGTAQEIEIMAAAPGLPVLLVIYGGPEHLLPGSGFIDRLRWSERLHTDELIGQFTVVLWDQNTVSRGKFGCTAAEYRQPGRRLRDAAELSNWLRVRFGQDKILLCGLSWGSLTGLWLAYHYPEKYHGYIGVSQIVSEKRGCLPLCGWERLSLREYELYDAMAMIHSLELPVHFVQGQKDRTLSAKRLQQFYDRLSSPRGKGLSWTHHISVLHYGESGPVEQELLAFAQAIGAMNRQSGEGWMFTIDSARR